MLINKQARTSSASQMVFPVYELGVSAGQGLRRKIYETRVLVACDAHLPYLDPSLLSMMRATIHEFGIQCVLWLGDLFDSHKYNHRVAADQRFIWKQEKQVIVDLLMLINEDLEKTGGYQMISRGYHDNLWLKRQSGTEDMRSLIRNLDPAIATFMQQGRISISESATLEGIPNVRGEMTWIFTHPLHYVPTPFQTPRELARREQKHCIAAHAHHFDVAKSEEETFWTVEASGIFRDKFIKVDARNEIAWRRKKSAFWVIMEDSQPLGFCSGCESSMITSCPCVRSMQDTQTVS